MSREANAASTPADPHARNGALSVALGLAAVASAAAIVGLTMLWRAGERAHELGVALGERDRAIEESRDALEELRRRKIEVEASLLQARKDLDRAEAEGRMVHAERDEQRTRADKLERDHADWLRQVDGKLLVLPASSPVIHEMGGFVPGSTFLDPSTEEGLKFIRVEGDCSQQIRVDSLASALRAGLTEGGAVLAGPGAAADWVVCAEMTVEKDMSAKQEGHVVQLMVVAQRRALLIKGPDGPAAAGNVPAIASSDWHWVPRKPFILESEICRGPCLRAAEAVGTLASRATGRLLPRRRPADGGGGGN